MSTESGPGWRETTVNGPIPDGLDDLLETLEGVPICVECVTTMSENDWAAVACRPCWRCRDHCLHA